MACDGRGAGALARAGSGWLPRGHGAYGADAILAAAHWPDASSAVLIVGHQPTIGEVASYLISSIPTGLRVKKGSVWWIRSQLRDKTIESELHAVMYPEDV